MYMRTVCIALRRNKLSSVKLYRAIWMAKREDGVASDASICMLCMMNWWKSLLRR
jgi:hypothetical protein